jgi:tRNA A-37 threonylcarbamoyl transferase component Bud32
MNDIYEHKANKYKYKYLKLKKQYKDGAGAGAGAGYIYSGLKNIFKPLIKSFKSNKIQNIKYDFEFIGNGTYGCIISPPFQFNTIKNENVEYIKSNINEEELNNIFTSKDYVGKLLSCDNEVFNKEYKEYLKLNEIDPVAKYRSKLIFAAYMTKKELTDQIDKLLQNNQTKTETPVTKLYNCLKGRILIKNSRLSENYGYIISTRVGKSFKDHNLDDFNNEQIIKILKNLKESIGDLIQKIYDNDSIHGDIKFGNMTLDADLKVYFIDFGLMHKYKDLNLDLNSYITQNHQYPEILNIFFNIKKKLINKSMNKTELIELLKKKEYEKDKRYSIILILLNEIQLQNIDYMNFFELIDDEEHDLDYFYNKCIEPIAKNIDIYALILFIYQLFFKIFDSTIFNRGLINDNTIFILKELLKMALYNKINDPKELIIYLDGIINSINGTYKRGDITKKIRDEKLSKQNIILDNVYKKRTEEDKQNLCNYIEKNDFIVPFHDNITQTCIGIDTEDYKKEYKKLSLIFHPDKNKCEDNKVFKKINESYNFCNKLRQKQIETNTNTEIETNTNTNTNTEIETNKTLQITL